MKIGTTSVAGHLTRANLRSSNTEPVVRLNLETRGDEALMHSKLAELRQFLEA